MYQALFAQIDTHTRVLTANHRLASYLSREYRNTQPAHSNILPLEHWLKKIWQEHTNKEHLLTEFQAQLIWENIIRLSTTETPFLRLSSTAKLAREAFSLVKQWRLSLNDPLFELTEETQGFQQWAKQYQAHCNKHHVLDTEQLIERLMREAPKLSLPKHIILCGFIKPTPQLTQLLSLIEQRGCRVSYFTPETMPVARACLPLPDEMTELLTMAHWARELLEKGIGGRIGCIIPHLSQIRTEVESVFKKILLPTSLLNMTEATTPPFHISLAKPLQQYPLIHTALIALKLFLEPLSLSSLSFLLRSPFLGEAIQEASARAQADLELHRLKETHLTWQTCLQTLKRAHCPALLQRLQKIDLEIGRPKPRALKTPAEWVILFQKFLMLLGWPGERALSDLEQQLVAQWQDLLSEFSSIEQSLPTLNCQQAIQHLSDLAASTIFQANTLDAPVQILGTLEAVGIPFEHLWIMGLHDEAWPPAPKLNPFIPVKLQRNFAMPHASAEQELQFCRKLTELFSAQAKEVIFTYPRQAADQTLRPSALLKSIKEISVDDLQLARALSYEEQLFQSIPIETFIDDKAPAVTADEALTIRGGTRIIKMQSACPFRAFAEHRLGTDALTEPSLGFDAMERGTLIHHALEQLWKMIRTHEQLCAYGETELFAVIHESVNSALQKFSSRSLSQQFLNIEHERVSRLLMRWLALEKNRAPFSVIATEQRTTLNLAELTLHTIIDRVDQLEDGSQVIIDYKTGLTSMNDWFGERPNEPQLPLYCIASDDPVHGLIFAQIRANNMQFRGITLTEHDWPGVIPFQKLSTEPSWPLQLSKWRSVLENLAHAFYSGDAKVDPKEPGKTCQTCDISILCRVHTPVF